MLLRQKVYYYTDRQKALHSEGTHKLLHMREDKIMDNENKNKLSEKQLAQVSGGDIPNFPCSYGEQICPVCGWEDDPSQKRYPDMEGGANAESLNEARRKYEAKYGTE